MTAILATTLVRAGWTIGFINYLLTAMTLFNQGRKSLALIQLLVPPAELILPWVASPVLGLISATGAGLVILGFLISVWSSK